MDLNFSQNAPNWYASLEKPFFAPPAWLFGPAWTILYILIALAFIKTIQSWRQNQLQVRFVQVFVFNLLTNFLFSPLQFGLQNNVLALVDIILVLGSLVYLEFKTVKKQRLIFYLLLPYLLWVSYATVLQIAITLLNL